MALRFRPTLTLLAGLSLLALIPTAQAQFAGGLVENRGQWPDEVLYMARLPEQTVWVSREALVYDFFEVEDPDRIADMDNPLARLERGVDETRRVRGHVVELRFDGGAPGVARPGRALTTRLNYFIGNDPARHASNVPVVGEVTLEGLYEGVALRLRPEAGGLTLTFEADDPAWLAAVRLTTAGGETLVDEEGTVIVETSLGRRAVGLILGRSGADWYAGSVNADGVQVDLGRTTGAGYTTSPAHSASRSSGEGLDFSTFLGGPDDDRAIAMAVGTDGSATVAGYTNSSGFPTTPGAYDETLNGQSAAFVARLATDGASLVYSTFLGGTGGETAFAVAVGADGSATVAGETSSSDFPTTPGAYDETHNGGTDAFVARLAADGASLLYSTFLGGTNFEIASAVVVGADGSATVAGYTLDSDFPTTPGAYDETHNGFTDAFVAQLSVDGTSLVYSTFLGETDFDYAHAVTVGADGSATVAGYTWSLAFPTTPGAYDETFNGVSDVFVARLSADGSSLVYSTFLGGTGEEQANAMAVGADGSATVFGYTNGSDFPTTPEAYDETHNGSFDGFVARLSADGTSLVYATFLGGTGDDIAYPVALGADGSATVAGLTGSPAFPTTPGAYDETYNGNNDAFVVRLSADGTSLLYSTYLGGTGEDSAWAVAVGADGSATVAGYTESSDFPTTPGAYDETYNGIRARDAFVTRLDLSDSEPQPFIAGINPDPVPGFDGVQAVTLSGSNFESDAVVILNDVTNGDGPYVKYPTSVTPSAIVYSANYTNATAEWSVVVAQLSGSSNDFRFDVVAVGGGGAPVITGVSPSPVPAVDLRQPITISGSGFTPSTQITLEDLTFGGTFLIPPERTTYLSSTSILISANVTAYTADWTATAANGAQTSAPFPFAVLGAGGGTTAPVITAISPNPVIPDGGAPLLVEVSGLRFGSIPTVTIQRAGIGTPEVVQATVGGNGTSLTFTYAFPEEGTSYTVSVTTPEGTASATLSTVPPPSGPLAHSVTVGGLVFNAASLLETTPGAYTLSGSVNVEDALYFSGAVVVDENALTVSGNGQVYIQNDTATFTAILYEGAFDFSVNESLHQLIGPALESINMRLALAGLPVHIEALEILTDGARIEGSLEFPSIMGAGVTLTSLQVTKSGGVDFGGQVDLPTIFLSPGLTLYDLVLSYDSAEERFLGSAELGVGPPQINGHLYTVAATVEVIESSLNEVSFLITTANPVPIPATGLSLSGGGGGVEGLAVPPLSVFATADLVPTIQGSIEVLELTGLELRYTAGNGITATGTFNVFGVAIADASLTLDDTGGLLTGGINVLDILTGNASLQITGQASGVYVLGEIEGNLEIPDRDDFPYDWFDAIPGVDLPYSIGAVEAAVDNTSVHAAFDLFGRGAEVNLSWDGEDLSYDFTCRCIVFNLAAFAPDATFTVRRADNNPFEGQSVLVSPSYPNEGFTSRGASMAQAFDVDDAYETLIVRIHRTDGQVPVATLELPDGTVLTPTSLPIWATYGELPAEGKAFYTLRIPPQGTYTLTFEGTATHEVDVFGGGNRPSITLPPVVASGGSFEITWVDGDADSDAQIALLYDEDGRDGDGVLIADGLSEDAAANAYTWTPGAEVPTGDYYVYALADDGDGAPQIAYAPNTIRVIAPSAPAPPSGLDAVITADGIVLTWPSTEGLTDTAYWSASGTPAFSSPSAGAADSARVAIRDLDFGRTYTFALTARGSSGVESDFSTTVEVPYVSATENDAPTIGAVGPLLVTKVGQVVTASVQGTDPDAEALQYALAIAPPGMTVSSSGEIAWTPAVEDRGSHRVRVRVMDPGGLADSTETTVRVVDEAYSMGFVRFGSGRYVGYASLAMVVLTDVDLDTDPLTSETQAVDVYTSSDGTPVSVNLFETSVSSPLFVGAVALSEDGSSGVQVTEGDTLFVRYSDANPAAERLGLAVFTAVPPPSPVTIALQPLGAPIQIPAVGGMFRFRARLTNTASTAATVQMWTELVLPNGNTLGPLAGPNTVTLDPGESRVFTLRQNIPANAPAGGYTYVGHVGQAFPASDGSDSFNFTKLPSVPIARRTVRTGAEVGAERAGKVDHPELAVEGSLASKDLPFVFDPAEWVVIDEVTGLPIGVEAAAAAGSESMVTAGEALPLTSNLYAAAPNPFNPTTLFRYDVATPGDVEIVVYDVLGREVARLVDERQEPGRYQTVFNASRLASGFYVIRMSTGTFLQTQRVTLIR